MEIRFNDLELPDYIYITGYSYDVAPELSPYITEIPYKIGNIDGGVKRGNLTHTFDLTIDDTIFHTPFRVRQDLKKFVMGHEWEVSKLTSSEWEGRYINARVSSSPNIQDLILHGTTSIEFVSTDPFYYSEKEYVVDLTKTSTVFYDGLEKASTIITITPDSTVKGVEIINESTGCFTKLNRDLVGGNEVVLDGDKKKSTYKGEQFPELITMSSRWIYLEHGLNVFKVIDSNGKDVLGNISIRYRKVD